MTKQKIEALSNVMHGPRAIGRPVVGEADDTCDPEDDIGERYG